MAVQANGTLYLVDAGRDQILRRLGTGAFEVVAGNGKRGFSGDGGRAVNAEISVNNQSGIAVTWNGVVYFADSGNGRVRAVEPDGIIKTVAGGGSTPLSEKPLPALRALFGKPYGVLGLTLGPNSDLYIGASAVYRLTGDGILEWVVGKSVRGPPPKNWGGVYSNPAIQSDFLLAYRLAFDGTRDLLVGGGGGFGLYEMTRTGKLLFLENFRGDGAWGALAEAPGGSVVLCDRGGLSRFLPSGRIEPIAANLSSALGTVKGEPHKNYFIGGDGVAVAPNGNIYADTNVGNTFTSVNAIVEVTPEGAVRAIWRSTR